MSILDTIKSILTPTPPPLTPPRPTHSARARQSTDTADDLPFSYPLYVSPPPDPNYTWRAYDLDDKTLSRVSVTTLVELMADVSPEISRALWDFLRFCNPGYEAVALRPNSEDDEQDSRGQTALAAAIATLDELYGSTDVVIGRLFLGVFLRGAAVAELILDDQGREFVDLATPDPASMRFRKQSDPLRGTVWQLGQWQGAQFVPLDVETICYIPIDPLPGQPYGRAPVGAAISSALFLIGLLHDLRRVISQQGYPRIDIELDLEQLKEAMPPDIESNPEKFSEWVTSIVDEIDDVYSALEPDDAYIHMSTIKLNRPVGTVDSSSLGGIDDLIRSLERMVTRALKTMPLLMGSNEAVSETHANRQWEIHAAGIKAIQHLVESLLERLFGLALQAQGIQATVQWRFAELRASEMLRDAQTEAMEITNVIAKYNAGWISQDQASEEVTGQPADVSEPRQSSEGLLLIGGDGDGEETRISTNGKARIQYG